MMRLFEYGNNFRRLDFHKLHDIFRPNSFLPREERLKNSIVNDEQKNQQRMDTSDNSFGKDSY